MKAKILLRYFADCLFHINYLWLEQFKCISGITLWCPYLKAHHGPLASQYKHTSLKVHGQTGDSNIRWTSVCNYFMVKSTEKRVIIFYLALLCIKTPYFSLVFATILPFFRPTFLCRGSREPDWCIPRFSYRLKAPAWHTNWLPGFKLTGPRFDFGTNG